jgi:hypothetical protein
LRGERIYAGVPNPVCDQVADLFDKNEIVRLLMAICAINVWNRMAISTHQALPERDWHHLSSRRPDFCDVVFGSQERTW